MVGLGCGGNGDGPANDAGAPPGTPGSWGTVSDGGVCASGQSPCMGICTADRCLTTLSTALTLRTVELGPVAVDATDLYCLGLPTPISKIPIDGGPASTLCPECPGYNGGAVGGIALGAARVYWQSIPGGVFSISKGGGIAAPFLLPDADGLGVGFAVDSTSIYWSSLEDTTELPPFSVMKAPLSGGSPITLASAVGQPSAVAVDGASVYWVDSDGTTAGMVANNLKKVPLSGGSVTTLGTAVAFQFRPPGSSSSSLLAVAPTNVYWVSPGGDLLSVPLAGGTVTTLVAAPSTQAGVVGLAVDDTSVYWTYDVGSSPGSGSVMKLPLNGGTPVTLASANGWHVDSITVDATSVYCAAGSSDTSMDNWLMKITPK
jgi:hypothetical protein